MASSTKVEVAFELTVGDTPYFRLNDPVKGKLNNTNFRLGGPIWIDITDKVASVNVKRGKNRELERYNAGSAGVTLHNEDRTFDPLNTSSPYAGNIIPRRGIRVTTASYPRFTGVIEDWNLDYDVSGKSDATIVAADAFTLLAQQSLTAGTATPQTTGERVEAVLSMPTVAWPLTQRNIDTGSAQVGADVFNTNDSALSYLQKVEASEQGQLFMDRQGNVRFVNGAVTPSTGAFVETRTNIWKNPSIETNSTGFESFSTGGSVSRITTRSLYGVACLNFATTSNQTYGGGSLLFGSAATTGVNVATIQPNTTYTGSVYVFVDTDRYLRCGINFRNSSNVNLGENAGTQIFVPANTWTRIFVTATSPATAAFGGVRITQGASGNRTYTTGVNYISADGWFLEKTNELKSYFDGDTTDTFTARNSWTGTANASTSTQDIYADAGYPLFSDQGDGIPYTSATVSYGTELLYNQVTVDAPGFTSTQSNTISQVKYGITTTEVATLLSTSNAVESLALFWVAKYGEPEYRFQDLTISLDGLTGEQAQQVLDVELGDIVRITFTPNGVGSPIARYGQVNKIEDTITADRHTIVFGFGSLQFSFLILDDPGFGILDTNVLAF
jgi:hypothetical protein